jgi:hypothetical protein
MPTAAQAWCSAAAARLASGAAGRLAGLQRMGVGGQRGGPLRQSWLEDSETSSQRCLQHPAGLGLACATRSKSGRGPGRVCPVLFQATTRSPSRAHARCQPACRHFGVVRALLDANLLPRVVSGSSAGSLGARRRPLPALPPAAAHPCCARWQLARLLASLFSHVLLPCAGDESLVRCCCLPWVHAGAALLCTRTDAEVHELVADFPNTQGLDFFVSARILQPLRRASPGATTLLRQMLLCLPPTGCACPASTHAPLLPASLPQAHNRPADLVRHLLGSGYIQNHEFFGVRLRKLLGDLTFLDAYQRTGGWAGRGGCGDARGRRSSLGLATGAALPPRFSAHSGCPSHRCRRAQAAS